jgi:hypothetical protein
MPIHTHTPQGKPHLVQATLWNKSPACFWISSSISFDFAERRSQLVSRFNVQYFLWGGGLSVPEFCLLNNILGCDSSYLFPVPLSFINLFFLLHLFGFAVLSLDYINKGWYIWTERISSFTLELSVALAAGLRCLGLFILAVLIWVLDKVSRRLKCFTVFRAQAYLFSFLLLGLPAYEVSRDSTVGIATSYWLDDRVVGVRVPVGSRIFTSPCRSERLWRPPNLLYKEYPVLFRDKAAEAWCWPLTSN